MIMAIAKQLLIIGLMAASFTGNSMYALSSKYTVGFNWSLLKPLVERSKRALEGAEVEFKNIKASCFNAKECAKRLYEQQKNALKVILNELKQAYRTAKQNGKTTWFADKQLYKTYKKFVYKNWKKNGSFATF